MPERSYSLRARMTSYGLVIITAVVIFLAIFTVSYIGVTQKEIKSSNQVMLDFIVQAWEGTLSDADQFLADICVNNLSYAMLTRSGTSLQMYQAEYNLMEVFSAKAASSNRITGLFVAKPRDGIFRSAYSAGYGNSSGKNQRQDVDEIIKRYLYGEDFAVDGQWKVLRQGNYSMLVRVAGVRGTYVAAILDLDKYIVPSVNRYSTEALRVAYTDGEAVYANEEFVAAASVTPRALFDNAGSLRTRNNYLVQTAPIPGTPVALCIFLHQGEIMRLFKGTVVALVLIGAALLGTVSAVLLRVNGLLLHPVRSIRAVSERLARSDWDFALEESHPVEEIRNIDGTINRLVRQIKDLHIDNYEKELDVRAARLQYYQVQTKPHFYLNCLKNINALAQGQAFEKIQLLATAVSRHLRYTFRDNRSLVALREELDEVEDYLRILNISTACPVYLKQNVEEELMDCRVPPLLLQTFVENAFQHARTEGKVLSIYININTLVLEEERRVISVIISDNGAGYSARQLELLARQNDDAFRAEHIGISNLLHRLRLVYKERVETAFLNAPAGGACVQMILPMEEREEPA